MTETNQAVDQVQDQQENPEQKDSKTQVQNVDLPEAAETKSAPGAGSINILLDMHIPLTVVIGQTEIPVRRLLQLGPGSVLQLDKPVDAPADLYLRDSKFATGTVVVVEDKFAVRINNVLGVADADSNQKTE